MIKNQIIGLFISLGRIRMIVSDHFYGKLNID